MLCIIRINLAKFFIATAVALLGGVIGRICHLEPFRICHLEQFPALSKTLILMSHFLSVDAAIMVSKDCAIISENVFIIFTTQ